MRWKFLLPVLVPALGLAACGGDATGPATRQLTVLLVGPGAGTVTSTPEGIACSLESGNTTGTCSLTFKTGEVGTLTATPKTGSVFVGWGGAVGCESGQPAVDSDKTCVATFAPESYTQVKLAAVSAGFNADTATCGFADLKQNEAVFFHGIGCEVRSGRGFNVAVIDPVTGSFVVPTHSYDTWGDVNWFLTYPVIFDSLTTALSNIPRGALVMIAVGDDAGITHDEAPNLCTRVTTAPTQAVVQALKALGSARIEDYCYRDSWTMIAMSTGNGRGQVISEQLAKAARAVAQTTIAIP